MKRSISLSDSSVNFITATTKRGDDDPKWSSAINSALEQYKMLLVYSMPELTEKEWRGFIEAYRKSNNPAHEFPPRIEYYIKNNVMLEDIKLTPIEQMAVAYFCQIYWINDWEGYENFYEIKRNIISRLSE